MPAVASKVAKQPVTIVNDSTLVFDDVLEVGLVLAAQGGRLHFNICVLLAICICVQGYTSVLCW